MHRGTVGTVNLNLVLQAALNPPVDTGGAGEGIFRLSVGIEDPADLIKDLDQALAKRNQLAAHESIISQDGIWLGRDWLRVARGVDEKAGVLQREQEIKDLVSDIEETAARVEELTEQVQQSRVRQPGRRSLQYR